MAVAAVVVLVVLWYLMSSSDEATPPEPVASGIPKPGGTGSPSAGSGTGIVVAAPVQPASGSGGVTGASGANTFVPPVDNTNINTGKSTTPSIDGAVTVQTAPTPINLLKMVSLYPEPKFMVGGVSGLAGAAGAPGKKFQLAHHENGKYVFDYKSMKVDPGVKIMFSRYIGGGNTRRSFAVGQYNVPDMESWIRSYDRISGGGNWGYGSLTLDRFDTYQTEPIFMYVLSDAEWADAISAENAACNGLMVAWNKYSPGKYSEADCKTINAVTFGQVYTMP